MKTLVISDVHSNLDALRTIFNYMKRKSYQQIYCLGDFVGYGGEPNQVLDKLRTARARKVFVRGNHDRVAAGFDDGSAFNQHARDAAIWTSERLSSANRHFLRTMATGPVIDTDGTTLCHGSPQDEDEYIFTDFAAARAFQSSNAQTTFFGHTHFPSVFSLDPRGLLSGRRVRGDFTLQLDRRNRYLINPGSVGQPRDRNPKTAFLIYDSERYSVQFVRLEYDISAAQEAIHRAGLPQLLADRLSIGA